MEMEALSTAAGSLETGEGSNFHLTQCGEQQVLMFGRLS